MKKARTYQLILIPLLFVIAAVVGTLAYSRWVANHTVPGPGSLEGRLQGVGDWAEGEQGLELLGAYTFVTTEEIDTARIKKVYAYQLSDDSVYGWLSFQQEQQEDQWEEESAVSGTDANYVKVLLEAEAQHWEKDLFLGHYSLSGVFFAISDSPEALASYFLSCTEGNYYRGWSGAFGASRTPPPTAGDPSTQQARFAVQNGPVCATLRCAD